MLNENTSFHLKKISKLKEYTFHVPSYQRGYKWSVREALDLLNDIHEFQLNQGIYCLQPLVLKQRNHQEYELIDGQQRISTIFLILNALKDKTCSFEIDYQTRSSSSTFLNNSLLGMTLLSLETKLLEDSIALTKKINEAWKKYIQDCKAFDNVDNYHFYLVYQTILLWFRDKTDEEKQAFKTKLLDYTEVIWYEIGEEESPEKVFMNINSGKIALTNAELIKALFLISLKDETNKELAEMRQNEVAQEWDRIEYALQDDAFWYFINENPEVNTTTRIDFLFDIIHQKSDKESDPYYSYRKYDKRYKNGEALDWQEVKDLFCRLHEWFNDRTLYHYIGFLIARKIKTVRKIIELSKDKGITAFRGSLRCEIKTYFSKTRKEDDKEVPIYVLANLDYGNSDKEITDVLLLFNIETYQRSDANFRFPFDRFKKERWSLEHIHAQNAKEFTLQKQVKDWLIDIEILLNDIGKEKEDEAGYLKTLKKELNDLLDKLNKADSDTKLSNEHKGLLDKLEEKVSEELNKDNINNLALLDRITNSALGNQNFLNKRNKIVEIDKEGWVEENGKKEKAFIPICTKNAFLKYYTQKIDQMYYWGYQDRKDYLEAIQSTLNEYLPKLTILSNDGI